MASLREHLSEISIPVYLLVMLFSMSSWVAINGIWIELPLLVTELPEAWDLPSYLVIIIQIANVGPAAILIIKHLASDKVQYWPFIYIIMCIELLSCILLASLWKTTGDIMGEPHSIALLVLAAFLALGACSSSVVYLPYMANFKHQYMTAFYIGLGLSGLVPALVGLGQDVEGDPECQNHTVWIINETAGLNYSVVEVWPLAVQPNFSVTTFFYILFSLVLISFIAFTLLHYHPVGKREKVAKSKSYIVKDNDKNNTAGQKSESCEILSFSNQGEQKVAKNTDTDLQISTKDAENTDEPRLSQWKYALVLFTSAMISALQNGVVPSIESYSCLPYGYLAYTLSVKLARVASPLASFLSLFIATSSVMVMAVLGLGCVCLAGFYMYLAAMSPAPPLQEETSGLVIVILTSIILAGGLSYVKVVTSSIVMVTNGGHGLMLVGVVSQVGSMVGAIAMFICITETNFFTAMSPC